MTTIAKCRIEISSDGNARLRLAQHWMESFAADREVLLVAHSREAANDLHLQVVELRGAAFGIKRVTLNSIAARLAQNVLVESGMAPATNLTFTAVVARAIHSFHSKDKLTYFAPVATKPGFSIAVAKTLGELRMNEVGMQSLEQLTRGGKDLAAIAKRVEEELKAGKLADRAILFQAAIESVEDSDYVGMPLLLLDVVVHSRLVERLVGKLAARAESVLATVVKGDERTVEALARAVGERGCNQAAAGRRTLKTPKSLDLIKEHLFESSAPDIQALDASVRLSNWPGEPRECVEIVRSIQAEAAAGVPLDQIAVLLNSSGQYRSHLEEAFARAHIPAYFFKGTTTPDPAGRALLALLACAADGLSAKRFAEYLSLGELPQRDEPRDPEANWVGPDDELIPTTKETIESQSTPDVLTKNPEDVSVIDGSLRTPARWESLLVESAVIGGKDRWSRRLEGLANELHLRIEEAEPEDEASVEPVKRALTDLNRLRDYALPLIDRLGKLPASANWAEWLAHLRELTVNAIRDSHGVLETLAELEPMSSVGPVDLHEVQLVLESRLRDLRVKPPKRRYGRVFVAPVDAARGLSFQVVFVPGLAEKIFPKKIVEDSILPESQRDQINCQLSTRRDELEDERIALRLAIGAAQERVYLSYPRIDVQQSRPRVPSFYALEALRAAEGALPGFEEVASRSESTTRSRLGWPAPQDPNNAIDEAEYDLATLANLATLPKQKAIGAANYLLTANVHLARALRGRARRWLRRWTPNDGLVDPDEIALKSIARHQFSQRPFSASALQLYANCPYQFFLSTVMRLDLRQEPMAIEVIDPLTRGRLFHAAQFEVLTELKAKRLLPLKAKSLSTAFELVDRGLERLANEYEDTLAPAIPRVWQDGINAIRADLREWLRRMSESDDHWIPEKFELSFGMGKHARTQRDPGSIDDPVDLIGDLRLRGAIDMVERQSGDRYRITDHKTGKARAAKDTVVGGGRYLQPLLYALASKKLLNGEIESGRLYYCTADGGYEERIVVLDEVNVRLLNSVLSNIRQSLIDGFLPAAPNEDACGLCDFLAVCGGFEESRVKLKPKDRLIQIKALRDLP